MYNWDFGDGNTSTGQIVQHIYSTTGPFIARLTIQDSQGLSSTTSLKMFPGNTPPVPVIASPAIESKFGVAETITLTANATDAEDGIIPENRLYWRADIRHDNHTHPYVGTTYGSTLTLQMPAPEGLDAVSNSYLEVYLTAVDSQGLSRRIKGVIYPQLIDLTFVTEPTGLQLEVNAASFTAPQTIKSWKGYSITIQAKNQTVGTQQATFVSWSDGRAAKHNIAPKTNRIYTATFSLQ
jgi:PKD repeat protein